MAALKASKQCLESHRYGTLQKNWTENQTQQVLQTAKSKLWSTSMEDVRSEGGAAIWSCILVNSFEHFFKLEL